jgi:L-threonylcarbamoyladenylate synthase
MLPEHILAADGSIAIRIVQKAFVKKLIAELDQPLLSTSANLSDADFPKSFDEVTREIKNGVDIIFHPDLPLAETEDAQPSVIARFDDEGQLIFIRK